MGKKKKQDKPDKSEKPNKSRQKKQKNGGRAKKMRDVAAVRKVDPEEGAAAAKKVDPEEGAAAAKKAHPAWDTAMRKNVHTAKDSVSGKTDQKEDMAAVFRVFGDVHRLQILDLLQERELTAGELLSSLDIVQSTLSHHMKSMVKAGVVKCRRQGKCSCYSIDRDRLAQISTYLLKW